ncbi:tail fiber domain-containing protein (plasmid) [Aureispira anguillae]|uniref:Tail fiber domain-containing protein n=2 Tax=Aureispira anguillae TaxID=2864201 RepID=A0A915YM23_9BACT|nr:tail fiber domain-containing protein [Aureispira anguillae]
MLKSIRLILCLVLMGNTIFAQNVGIGTMTPNPSAKLDIEAADRGLLVPRISITNLNAAAPVSAPATSLLVYNTNASSGLGYYYWNGTKWIKLLNEDDIDHDWYEVGTTSSPDAISDNIFTQGSVGIGTISPTATLHVERRFQDAFLISSGSSDGGKVYTNYVGGSARLVLEEYDDPFRIEGISALTGQTTTISMFNSKVGIGVAYPTEALDVNGTFAYTNNLHNVLLIHDDTANTNNDNILIEFVKKGNHSAPSAAIKFDGYGSASIHQASMHFYTRELTDPSPQEQMMIHWNGNIGMGTNAPSEKLEVHGIIDGGNNTSTQGMTILTGRYGIGALTTLGSHHSDGGPVLGYGVTPLTGSSGYVSASGIANLERSALHLDEDIEFLSAPLSTTPIGTTIPLTSNMIIKNTGYVGIGTTNPLGVLHVYNSTPYTGNENDNASNSIVLHGAVSNAVGNHYGGITWANGLRKRAGISSVMEHSDSDHLGLAFWTQGTDGSGPMYESMRISYHGNVGIGTTAPSEKLEVCGNAKIVGQIQANSSSLSAGLTCSSDKRLKKNIKAYDTALETINLLEGKQYYWKTEEFADRGFDERRKFGFIAQEVEKVLPNLVYQDKKGYKSVDYIQVIPILTNAIQEQQKVLEEQEKRVKLQQSENEKLINLIQQLEKRLSFLEKK